MSMKKQRAKRVDIAWGQFARAVRLYRGNGVLSQPMIAMLFAKMIGLCPEMRECLSGEGSEDNVRRLSSASFIEMDAATQNVIGGVMTP